MNAKKEEVSAANLSESMMKDDIHSDLSDRDDKEDRACKAKQDNFILYKPYTMTVNKEN